MFIVEWKIERIIILNGARVRASCKCGPWKIRWECIEEKLAQLEKPKSFKTAWDREVMQHCVLTLLHLKRLKKLLLIVFLIHYRLGHISSYRKVPGFRFLLEISTLCMLMPVWLDWWGFYFVWLIIWILCCTLFDSCGRNSFYGKLSTLIRQICMFLSRTSVQFFAWECFKA